VADQREPEHLKESSDLLRPHVQSLRRQVFAGYTIVSPELVVETLLGPMGSIPPANGLEKLEPSNEFSDIGKSIGGWEVMLLLSVRLDDRRIGGMTCRLIVSPELVVETLLGPMGSIPPANGLEKLELAMAQQRVQPTPSSELHPVAPGG
jgi:hypothetical protein